MSRYGRRSRYGRKKIGSRRNFRKTFKKQVVGASIGAAKSGYAGGAICKSLGQLWPACMIVKLRYSTCQSAHAGSATCALAGAAPADSYYNNVFTCYPYDIGAAKGPLEAVPYGAGAGVLWTPVAGQSTVNKHALGITRLFAAANAASQSTGVYSRLCVLKCQLKYDYTFYVTENEAKSPATMNFGLTGPQIAGKHILHPVGYKDTVYVAPSTCDTFDVIWSQGDVRRKSTSPKGNPSGFLNAANGMTGFPLQTHRLIWRHTVWPHRLLEMGFTDYVSDQSSFGTVAALPTNYAGVQCCGFFPRNSNGSALSGAPSDGVVHIEAVFTCLFKDIISSLIN